MIIIIDMNIILDIFHCPRNKIYNFPWNECFCLPVESGIFRIGNTGRHQFPACSKRGGDLYRLDVAESKYGNQIAPSSTFLKDGYLKSKTKILSIYIYIYIL